MMKDLRRGEKEGPHRLGTGQLEPYHSHCHIRHHASPFMATMDWRLQRQWAADAVVFIRVPPPHFRSLIALIFTALPDESLHGLQRPFPRRRTCIITDRARDRLVAYQSPCNDQGCVSAQARQRTIRLPALSITPPFLIQVQKYDAPCPWGIRAVTT